ncbi:Xylanase inhibitor [Theobroma cacao]|nr:Xylanase inhibitor [Theobroma cacao]
MKLNPISSLIKVREYLMNISIGTPPFEILAITDTEGNIIIDSGTTLTVLPQEFYLKLETLVVSEIDSKRVDAPAETLSRWYEAQNDFKVPNITVRFTNADVKLSPLNTFVLVSESVSCFSFTTISDFSIYGNLAQMNFLVGYDIENQAASFKPTACTKE